MLKRLLALALSSGILLTACTGNGSTSNGNNTPIVQSEAGVIIDPMSNVPVLNGTGTQGTLYIHNYTNQTISGLSFNLNQATFISQVKSLIAKAGLNLSGGIEDKNGFVLLNSEHCVQIAANSSCAINFTTPNLSFANQGSALVNVSYKLNGKSVINSQVVNYNYVDSSLSTGVNFTGNVDLSGTPGTTKYVVGYLYGGNANGGVYKNVNLVSNNPTATISGGFINSQEVAPNQVIAVEYQVAIQNNQKSFVEIVPTWGDAVSNISHSYVNVVNGAPLAISIDPKQNTANYLFGNVPILIAATGNTIAISVVNNGNGNGSTLTASKTGGTPNGIDVDISDCTANKLQANTNGTCNVVYIVRTYTPGSTTVSYKDANNNIVGSQVVYWNNDQPIPAVFSTPTFKYVEMAKESDSNIIEFNFANIGQAPLSDMVITPVVTGPVEWKVTESNCDTAVMGVDGSCYVKGYLKPLDDGVGLVYYTIVGQYDNTMYDFLSLPVRYMIKAAPEVVITPASIVNVTVLANNVSSTTNTYVAKNIGNDPALITGINLSAMTNLHKPVISESGTCDSVMTLGINESCSIVVNYGPELSDIAINESGSTHIVIDYHGGTPDTSYQAISESYNYKLVGNDTYLQEQIIATGFDSGSGTNPDPYLTTALDDLAQIKVIYTNPSVNYAMESFNLNINNLPYGMKIVSKTCPTENNVAQLAMGDSCEVIFGLDKELLKTSPQGGSVVFNFTTPTGTWTTPLGFYEQAGSNIYINYLQPAVTLSFSVNNGSFESTVLNAVLTNASSGVSPFIVNISAVNRWLEESPVALSNNCTVTSSDFSISCSLENGANESANIKYIMPTYAEDNESATIPLFYSTSNFGSLSPVFNLIRYTNSVSWQNVGSPGFSANAVNETDLAIDESGIPYIAYKDATNSGIVVMKFNGSSWDVVGNGSITGGGVNYPNLAINTLGTPYVAYQNNFTNKATVMKFTGVGSSGWESVGSMGFTESAASYISLAINKLDVPYIAYRDGANSNKVTVMSFNGSNWVSVGESGFSVGAVEYVSLAINKFGVPYVAYRNIANSNKATVMKFDGTNWVNVGSESVSSSGAEYISLAIDNLDTPYIAYRDFVTTKIAVMKFNGVAWNPVGNMSNFAGFGAFYTSLAINKFGVPYVAYRYFSNDNKATVMKFNGNAWVNVGSTAGVSQGSAAYTSLAISNKSDIPYLAYKDESNSNKATVMQYK